MKLRIEGKGTVVIRSSAVIVAEGHVLLHRHVSDEFWSLIGGGVEFTETSSDAIIRETQEELGAVCSVDRLLWIVESFFGPPINRWHEVGFYYLLKLDDPALIPSASLTPNGKEDDLLFRWFPVEEIRDLAIYPVFLRAALLDLPGCVEHVVNNEIDGS